MSLQKKSLLVAMELSNKKWKLVMGDGSSKRERSLQARGERAFLREIAVAKEKLGLEPDAQVVCCYEAGRDGFWIDRMLKKHGIKNYVLDPASIEVPRRARQRKTDRLDAQKLLKLLVRYELWSEKDSFSVVRVPEVQQEAQMRTHRQRDRLKKERGMHRARIKSLCVLHGITISNPAKVVVEDLRDWEGKPLASEWLIDLKREQQRLHLVEAQMKELEEEQVAALADPQTPTLKKAHKLQQLRSIGLQTSWVLAHECLGWREFKNRKQVGSFAGLTGTPFDSGDTLREQGISKAGSGRVRTTMIELAWLWVRYQPNSELTKWYIDRYVRGGSKRVRRKGIVALARKLLVALWKYVEHDIVPEGAILTA